MKDKIIFFFPSFKNLSGHENSFLEPLNTVFRNLNIEHQYIVSKNNKIDNKEFYPIWESSNSKIFIIKLFINFFFLIKNILVFSRLIRQKKFSKLNIYCDGYTLYDLVTIYSLFSKKNDITIFFYIRNFYNNNFKNRLFVFIIKLFFQKFSLKILTDTEILQDRLKALFKKDCIHLLPIPHTFSLQNEPILNLNKNEIKILCPGPYRDEKYGKNLHFFIQKNKIYNFHIRINEKSNIKGYSSNLKISYFKDSLSKFDYMNEMKATDLVLLPYCSANYKEKSSGVFVESVFMGKLPFVSDNTWMSYELNNFALQDLIVVDWENFDLMDRISALSENKFFKNFRNMIKYYKEFHNIQNFENKFNKILKK